MYIRMNGVPVQDQDRALTFYTEILGFQVKHNIPVGEYKWLTVVSPKEPDAAELLLEPISFEETKVYQKSLYEKKIPWTQFQVDSIEAEYERLSKLGVQFGMKPTNVGTAIVLTLDDTCGNFIQLIEML